MFKVPKKLTNPNESSKKGKFLPKILSATLSAISIYAMQPQIPAYGQTAKTVTQEKQGQPQTTDKKPPDITKIPLIPKQENKPEIMADIGEIIPAPAQVIQLFEEKGVKKDYRIPAILLGPDGKTYQLTDGGRNKSKYFKGYLGENTESILLAMRYIPKDPLPKGVLGGNIEIAIFDPKGDLVATKTIPQTSSSSATISLPITILENGVKKKMTVTIPGLSSGETPSQTITTLLFTGWRQ